MSAHYDYKTKDVRLIWRIDSAGQQGLQQLDGSTPQPVNFIEISTPRGLPTRFEIWAEITLGGGSLLKFPNQPDPVKWTKVFQGIQYQNSGRHREDLEVLSASGPATITIVKLSRPDGFGGAIEDWPATEVNVQVN